MAFIRKIKKVMLSTSLKWNRIGKTEKSNKVGKVSIYYSYDAIGNKLRKSVVDSTTLPAKVNTTLYVGNAIYIHGMLQFFATQEGRARVNADKDGWVYDYFLKDHLGNTRMETTDDYNVSSPILETTSYYYPFRLQQKGIGVTADRYLHKYKNTFHNSEINYQRFAIC